MKKREFQELKNETVEKLREKVEALRTEVVTARLSRLGEVKTNVKIAHNKRREIAQMLTLITDKLNAEKKETK